MADISALGELQQIEPLDMEQYVDNRESQPLPKRGKYVVQAPPSFPTTAFGRTLKGALSVQVDPVILGPTNEGFTIKFTKVSNKVFKRGGVNVSQLGDYLRATGLRSGKLTDEQAQADAVEQTANSVYEIEGDWRAYEKATGFQVEGMERFPSDGNGGHSPWYQSPTEKDPITGEPVMLRANFVVTRYIAKAN